MSDVVYEGLQCNNNNNNNNNSWNNYYKWQLQGKPQRRYSSIHMDLPFPKGTYTSNLVVVECSTIANSSVDVVVVVAQNECHSLGCLLPSTASSRINMDCINANHSCRTLSLLLLLLCLDGIINNFIGQNTLFRGCKQYSMITFQYLIQLE